MAYAVHTSYVPVDAMRLPHVTAVRLHKLLFVVALLVPALTFVAGASRNLSDIKRDSRENILRMTNVMAGDTDNVFQKADLLIGRVNDRFREHGWQFADSPETEKFLAEMKVPLQHIIFLTIVDANGWTRAGSAAPGGAPVNIADRDYFQAQRERDAGTFVGAPLLGLTTGARFFGVSRRLASADGSFQGIILVGIAVDRLFAGIPPRTPHHAFLVRSDGVVLAREPVVAQSFAWPPLPPDHPFMVATRANPLAGMVKTPSRADGLDTLYGYRKLADYPVWVSYGEAESVIMQPYFHNLWVMGGVAAVTCLMLMLLSWLALSATQAEHAALAELRHESERRRAAEQRMWEAQKMEAVGQLTGGIAHDFNNLLMAVIGNLELIGRAPEIGRATHQRIALALGAAERGARLTASLLAFSRRQVLRAERLDVNALLTELKPLLLQGLSERIRVEFALDPDVGGCQVDRSQLEAALLNLVINARDATPDGGKLVISTWAAQLNKADLAGNTDARPGAFIAICVRDTGHGMPPEVIAHAFEPFFTTREVGKGTGLGLSQVYGFARQSGGHVVLRSQTEMPGGACGTEVTLFLQRAELPASVIPAPGSEGALRAWGEGAPHARAEETLRARGPKRDAAAG